jgi:photosystem II stability/assembly factor-like uncharacterized protein
LPALVTVTSLPERDLFAEVSMPHRLHRQFIKSTAIPFVLFGILQGGLLSAVTASAQSQTSAPEKLPPDPESAHPAASGPEHDQDDLMLPMKRNLWFQQQRAYPNAHIPRGAYWRSQVQKQMLVARHSALLRAMSATVAAQADPFSGVTWTPDGPAPAAAYYGPTPYSGRATAIAVHPTDPNTVYLGTAAGGVWKTTDGGQTWTQLTDSQASLAIGAVAIDPNNPNTIFVGTGEPDFSADSYYGQGLLKSTDAGATWTLIRTPFTSGDTAPDFTQIAVQPGNSNVVLAGNLAGLYRSADGGNTWAPVIAPGTYSGYAGATSVMFDVKNSNVAYAGIGGYYIGTSPVVMISKDAGQTWTSFAGTGANAVPAGSAVIRTALAEDAAGKTLFAAFARSDYGSPGSLYSTSTAAASWTQLQSPGEGFDWYRNALAVVPSNPAVIYASGGGLSESTDGGQTWAENSGGTVYADQHAFAFSADGSRMYLADDGGVFVTLNPSQANASFTSLNTNINTMTFYPGFSILAGQPNSLLAGSQDHGLNLYLGSLSWPNGEQSGYCGDGGSVYVDPQGNYAYAHCQGGAANWAANSTADASTASWVAAQSGISTSDRWPWVADIKGDQQTMSTVYTVTNRLYQSTNNAASWTAISGDLTANNSDISTVGISPSDSNTIYTGAGDGVVSVTTNALAGAGATWTTLSGLPNRYISKIVVQPDSPKDVYLTVSGFDSGHVFHSIDGGGSWADISGDLPNTPVDSILVDPDLLNTIYVATDTGVYVSQNGGTNWTPLGQGLPNVVVQDILMYEPTRTLRVITHGRGAWDAILPMPTLTGSPATLAFATQTAGINSSAQAITLTNTSRSATVGLSGFQLIGQFQQTNNCGASLGPGASCQVNVSFSPVAAGSLEGRLIVSSATNNVSIALAGAAVATPNAAVDRPSLAFWNQTVETASVSESVHLSNPGGYALAGIAISVGGANPGNFSQTNTCGTTLAAGGTCVVYVTFTPSTTGTLTASLHIADSAANSPQVVALTGTATTSSAASGLQFIPVAPCRIADTRAATGPFGGPELSANTSREFNIPQSVCNIPNSALAYSLNVTAVPDASLNYLTLWSTWQTQPYVSTLNSDGRIKANAAMMKAGPDGGVSVFASNATNVILDINGYFVPAGAPSALSFYPVSPCRVADTRKATGPLGGPFLPAGGSRSFPVQSSTCGIPSSAKVYSLNVTAVPHATLDYLTSWATGQPQPYVSTLNSSTGAVTANAAIVPAGSSGEVSIFVSDAADVILDVNGYFAPPATGGRSLYTTSPCRVIDTRPNSFTGPTVVNVEGSPCAPPSTAQAYLLNATVVPVGPLNYLTIWPDGSGQPYVSTLNADDAAITSNMAIVPTVNGSIEAYADGNTNLILDLSGYFAP